MYEDFFMRKELKDNTLEKLQEQINEHSDW